MFVSLGRNRRTNPLFSPYRVATFPDSTDGALSQGTGLNEGERALRERFRVLTVDGNPVVDFFSPESRISGTVSIRNIVRNDPPVSMENILVHNERNQNWMCSRENKDTQGNCIEATSAFDNYLRFRQAGGFPFTAQTVISSSYGLMQVLYETAVLDLGFVQQGIGRSPSRIFEPRTGVDLGTAYFRRLFRLTFPLLTTTPLFVDVAELKRKFGVILEKYNRGPRAQVDETNLRDYATQIVTNSETFFPLR